LDEFAAAGELIFDRFNFADDGDCFPGLDSKEGRNLGPVFIAEGQMIEEIEDGREAQLTQFFGHDGTDTGKGGDGRCEVHFLKRYVRKDRSGEKC